ncbi:DMT family transporter [uncultured Marinococcus sp.]|uniref:DMT family transporter n=1 Tax=uncultured Marinococcus sp. TaxID=487012 RepID=UPI0026381240|nr:DMT family transporter [uncultured Marinococcus sp.]
MNKSTAFLLIISIIAISFAAIFVKWSEAPATILSMYRMYIASLFLLPFVWLKRHDFKNIKKQEWVLFIFSGVFLGMHFALWFGSLKLTTVASSTIILALQPVVALAGGFLIYKERVSVPQLITISLSIFGVVIIGLGDLGRSSSSALIGNLLSFLSVIAVVVYLLIGQRVVKRVSHWLYSFIVFFVAGISLHVFNAVSGVPVRGYGAEEWQIFMLLAFLPTIAHVIYNHLLNFINTSTISMTILGEPVGATILAFFILGEEVVALQIIGGIIVLLGVGLFLIQQQRAYQL